MGAVVSARNVRHRRGGRDVLAIDQLDLRAGERLAVLGPNGAGKTTLLRLLAGLDAPTTGRVEVDGVPIAHAEVETRRNIGYATQRSGLLSTSVMRNVELPLRWRGMDARVRRAVALAALERLGVAGLADRKALSLSGGEAQRVSLARALAIEPRLLLLDEPAAGLDAEARRAFFDDLEVALSDRASTVVHVSHRAEEALRLGDRVAVFTDGTIRQLDEPAVIVQRPADGTVARLVGYENVLPVEVDASSQVLVDGTPCGVVAARHWPSHSRRVGKRDPRHCSRRRASARHRGTCLAGSWTLGGDACRHPDTACAPRPRQDPASCGRERRGNASTRRTQS